MNITILKPEQIKEELDNFREFFRTSCYGMNIIVYEDYPAIMIECIDQSAINYVKTDFNTWMDNTIPSIVSEVIEHANL